MSDREPASLPTIGDLLSEVPSLLHLAAQRTDSEAVESLLAAGADVNAAVVPSGRTPLHYVFVHRLGDHPTNVDAEAAAIVETLVKAGADVNARAAGNWTPLDLAVQGGGPKAVGALLEAGGDMQAGRRYTALHLAAWRSDGEAATVVEVLLRAGADVNAESEDGSTPLHHAMQSNGEGVVALLLQAGADDRARDRHGDTPWDVARAFQGKWPTLLWRLCWLFRAPNSVKTVPESEAGLSG